MFLLFLFIYYIFIGTGQVIKGWDIGIMSMKLGEKAELTIKP
jgi:FKBP-type peptidyl-prolyl cis-trans isomerase